MYKCGIVIAFDSERTDFGLPRGSSEGRRVTETGSMTKVFDHEFTVSRSSVSPATW